MRDYSREYRVRQREEESQTGDRCITNFYPHASVYLFCFTRLVGLYLRPGELRRNASNEHKRIKYAELSEEAKEEKKTCLPA